MIQRAFLRPASSLYPSNSLHSSSCHQNCAVLLTSIMLLPPFQCKGGFSLSCTISKGVHFEINAVLPPLDSLSRTPYPCMKKERISFPCTPTKPWTGPNQNTWRKKMRPDGRISTHMSFESEICPVFLWNDLLALILNLNAVGGGRDASSRPMSHREAARAPLPRSCLKYSKIPAVGIAGKCCQPPSPRLRRS